MKLLTTAILVFSFSTVLGQNPENTKELERYFSDDSVLYVIDGKELVDTIQDLEKLIPAKDIFAIKVIKGDTAKAIYGEKWQRGVIAITSKAYAQNQVEMMLTRLSKHYATYRQTHKDDHNFIYVLNGKQIVGSDDEILRVLFNLPINNVTHASIIDAYKFAIPKTIIVMVTDE